jgi:hypothetical protein
MIHPNVTPGSLGAVVRSFKSSVTKHNNTLRHTPGQPVWQRNYYEHVIRDAHDLAAIREYVAANPARWGDATNHPAVPCDPHPVTVVRRFGHNNL